MKKTDELQLVEWLSKYGNFNYKCLQITWDWQAKKYYCSTTDEYYSAQDIEEIRAFNPEQKMIVVTTISDYQQENDLESVPEIRGMKRINISAKESR
jgi:hypothetical protein